MTECDCPICPLVKANTHVCDVIVQIADLGYNIMPDSAKQFHEQYYTLALIAKQQKTKINKTFSRYGTDHEYHVKRLTNDLYKVCFHTKPKEKDPLDMD